MPPTPKHPANRPWTTKSLQALLCEVAFRLHGAPRPHLNVFLGFCHNSVLLIVQTAKSLQALLRRGAFDFTEQNPRMLPRMYTPTRLDVETGVKSQAGPAPKARSRVATGRGRGRGAAAAAGAADTGA